MCANVSFPIISPITRNSLSLVGLCLIAMQLLMFSYGVMIHNHEGLVMLAEGNISAYYNDVNLAEAEALYFSL